MEHIYLISYPFEDRRIEFDPLRYYERKRLNEMIDRHKSLSLIHVFAETGSGKSSFVYGYIAQKKALTIWVNATTFPVGFHLADSIAEGLHALSGLPRISQKDDIFHYIARTLIAMEMPMYLVIDNFQFLKQDEEILTFLNHLLSIEIPSLTMIIISNSKLDFSVSRWKARGQYLKFTTGDLAFTYEELTDFFTKYHGISLEKYELDIIFKETKGWIAGCQLILLYLEQNLSAENQHLDLNFIQNIPDVYDYINREIFEKELKEFGDFMTRTSLLTQLDPAIINQYLKIENAQEILQTLSEHHTYITKSESGMAQYHHLFRLFLYEKYNQLHPDTILTDHLRLSYILEEKHLFLDAFAHAVASGNYLRAAELMHIISYRYNSFQILDIMDGKLEEISPLLVLADITLFLTRCIPEKTLLEFIAPLEKELRKAQENKDLVYATTLQHRLSGIYYHFGNLQKARNLLEEVLQNAYTLQDYSMAAFSLQLLADCCYEMHEYKTSIVYARQALFLTEKYDIPSIAIHCLEVLSRLQKNAEQAQSYITQALSLTTPNSYAAFWLYASQSKLMQETNPTEAVRWAQKAIDALSPHCCQHDKAYTYWILGEAYLTCGEYEKAKKSLDIAYKSSEWCGLLRLHILEVQTKLAHRLELPKLLAEKQKEIQEHCAHYQYTWITEPAVLESKEDFPILEIKTLGKFQVTQQGKTVSFKRVSSLRILQFLITYRGQEKNRDIIAEEIFSDLENGHTNYFHVALSSLRKDLNPQNDPKGTDYILRSHDRYQLNMKNVRLDVEEFLSLCQVKSSSKEERIRKLLKAVDLYQGDYFEEYPYEPYLEIERESLKKIQMQNLYEIAAYYQEHGESAWAVTYYERILQMDSYQEEASFACLELLIKMRNLQKAKKMAEQMIQMLEGELGIFCSERIKKLFSL